MLLSVVACYMKPDTEEGYQCACPEQFTGPTCARYRACASSPCENYGECVDVGEDFQCTCFNGFQGIVVIWITFNFSWLAFLHVVFSHYRISIFTTVKKCLLADFHSTCIKTRIILLLALNLGKGKVMLCFLVSVFTSIKMTKKFFLPIELLGGVYCCAHKCLHANEWSWEQNFKNPISWGYVE